MYYSNESVIFLDGAFIKANEASTDLFSQSLHYGIGAFEGIRSYKTANGINIFKGAAHFQRLLDSCKALHIPLKGYSMDDLLETAHSLLEKNKMEDAYIRPLVFCGPHMALTAPLEAHLMICAWSWDRYHGDKQVQLCISPYQRPNPKSVHLEAKASGYYINSILASTEAKQRGYDDALLLDLHGNVAEASVANFFYEKDGALYTPQKGHILPGITRDTVMGLCKELEIPVFERTVTPNEIFEADAAFICGTAAEITGVEGIDKHLFPKPWKESIGAVIHEAYQTKVLDKSFNHVII